MLITYRLLSVIFFPIIFFYLLIRLAKKKEDKNRFKERFGIATTNRPKGHLVWLHAVSVGEINSAFSLIPELLAIQKNTSILITTTTLTSATIVATKLSELNGQVLHQFLPVDSVFCVRKFLYFWKPSLAIFIESEIWPNLLFEVRKSNIPNFLVNARISEKSFRNWRFATKIGLKIFDYFTAIFIQNEGDKKRFEQLTNQKIFSYGNLKSQAQDLHFDIKKLEELKSQIGDRRFWLATNTHAGEERIILRTHQQLKKIFPNLLTILVPRHPNRAEEIKEIMKDLILAQRSKNEIIVDTTEIYLADSLNELGIFYHLADFTFLGGSLVDVGGHNPYEPAKLGCAIISGHKVSNSKEIFGLLTENDACIIVQKKEELIEVVAKFLQDKSISKSLSTKATAVIKNSDNIAKKIVSKIDSLYRI